MIYLDSYALVKLVIAEKESEALTEAVNSDGATPASSQLALAEVIRTVRRSCFDNHRQPIVDPVVQKERIAKASDLLDGINLVVLNKAVLLQAAAFEDDPHVGTLDAIHLVSAQRIGPELTAFITYDKQLARAAVAAGLPLLQPS
ncbi:MAG TPA: type II toxin-antitoxin system VapC family toxin [Actinocrinis sp.]|nr:type II toxin-antitoxin system VapC family toxin [Actinocrinis sp.]